MIHFLQSSVGDETTTTMMGIRTSITTTRGMLTIFIKFVICYRPYQQQRILILLGFFLIVGRDDYRNSGNAYRDGDPYNWDPRAYASRMPGYPPYDSYDSRPSSSSYGRGRNSTGSINSNRRDSGGSSSSRGYYSEHSTTKMLCKSFFEDHQKGEWFKVNINVYIFIYIYKRVSLSFYLSANFQ